MSPRSKIDNPASLDGWMLSESFLDGLTRQDAIHAKADMKPCGCSVKLDLKDVVYPALRAEFAGAQSLNIGTRVDAALRPGRVTAARRFVIPTADLEGPALAQTAKLIADFGGDTLVELFSTKKNYFADRNGTQEQFARVLKAKIQLIHEVERLNKTGLIFGKGHSIRAGGDIVMLDGIKVDASAPGYSLMNNDTIITADSLLKHTSLITVWTALNNALNDLFLHGVTDNLVIYPVYDGNAEESALIQQHLRTYAAFFGARGMNVNIVDNGPLNAGMKIVGATVTGHTMHEVPRMGGMKAGQALLATRHLGDLSLLAMARAGFFEGRRDYHAERLRVLQKFCTPNFLAAKLLQKYLPQIGQKFDMAKHVSFATDISGPGLSALEEGSVASQVGLRIDDLKFMDERSLSSYRKDHTSSTNGPLVFAGAPRLLACIEGELKDLGYDEAWRLGSVTGPDAEDAVSIAPALYEKYKSDNPRLDFFAPEVQFDDGAKVRMPIFDKLNVG